MYGYVIFTDIEKYSTLKDADLKIYFNKIIPLISEDLKEYKDAAIIWNTWGDAIFAIYDKAESAINMALAYREAFTKLNFDDFGIKKLNPRIAGNFGEFELIFDPVSGKQNVHGTLVNLTARIEPVTTPGEIFVTKEFRDMSCSSYDKVEAVRFEDMGEIKLPKNAGILNLYRLCKRAETPIKPAGIVISKFDFQIQAPIKPVNNIKSLEQRLSSDKSKLPNLENKTTLKEDKLDKLANVLKEKEVKNLKETKKEEPNFIKIFIQKFKNKIQKIKVNKNLKSEKNSNPAKNLNPVKKNNETLLHNPFLIAVAVFVIALISNYLLETDFSKNLFNWTLYYFNLALFNLKMPLISGEFMENLNPWMWLRGFLISSFAVGQIITQMKKQVIKFKNIIFTPFLAVFLHLGYCFFQENSEYSKFLFTQNFYINLASLWFVCFTGFFKGSEINSD